MRMAPPFGSVFLQQRALWQGLLIKVACDLQVRPARRQHGLPLLANDDKQSPAGAKQTMDG